MQPPSPGMWQVHQGGWQCCSAHSQGHRVLRATLTQGHLEGGWGGHRGADTQGFILGLSIPILQHCFLEDLHNVPAENLKMKLSKTVFNALTKGFYRSYQKCECCELGLGNTYPSSSHSCSSLSVCGERSVLSHGSVYHFMQANLAVPGEAATGAFPAAELPCLLPWARGCSAESSQARIMKLRTCHGL